MTTRLMALLAAGLLASTAVPASALTIVLKYDANSGFANNQAALDGFKAAAAYWQSVITTNVTVNIDISLAKLPTNVLGSTGTTQTNHAVQFVENRLKANSSGSSVDKSVIANLPPLIASAQGLGGVNVITPGYTDPVAGTGIDNTKAVYDTVGSFTSPTDPSNDNNNIYIGMSTANAKALGYTFADGASDASIQFSSEFAFDYKPGDGIDPNKIDFVGVATHEIGHALGFLSGVDTYDILGSAGPLASQNCGTDANPILCQNLPLQQYAVADVLDLFRYSNDPNKLNGGKPTLDWTTKTDSFFSIDGGKTSLALFSTGSFNGDGDQASHWKDNQYFRGTPGCPIAGPSIGIMDPTFAPCQQGIVTGLDLAAFDAIGWTLNVDALKGNYAFTTGQIADLVPEPATWAMMIAGFGMVGMAARRRRLRTA